jgi:hypothetical protein
MIIETRYYHPDWWGAAEPIYVVSIPWTKEHSVGKVSNIVFRDILCKSENGVLVYGAPNAAIDSIVFDGVHVTLDKFTDEPGGRYDLRPCEGDDNGFSDGVFNHDTAGFTFHHASNVTLLNCSVTFGQNRPAYFGKALEISEVQDLELIHFRPKEASEVQAIIE